MARASDVPEFSGLPTVRIDQTMPEKDSVIAMSDTAKWFLVECICYCGRTESDGLIPVAWVKKNARPTTIRQMVDQGHLELQEAGTHYHLVDYLRWNRQAVEIDSIRASKKEAGEKGAHMRWHVPARKKVKGCSLCYPEQNGNTNG